MDTEIWRDVEGYDGLYQVSNLGRVKSFARKTPRILKLQLCADGYLMTALCRNYAKVDVGVHRLVAQAFVPNPDNKPEVNHINGVKTDNRVENLEWCTRAENARHAFATGLNSVPQGEEHYNAKLTNEQVIYIRENPDNLSQRELARIFTVSHRTVTDIQRGRKYRNAGGTIRTEKLPHPRRIPDDIRKQIRAEYKRGVRGHSMYALAKKFGIYWKTVYNIVHET